MKPASENHARATILKDRNHVKRKDHHEPPPKTPTYPFKKQNYKNSLVTMTDLITVKGRLIIELKTKQDWVNKIPNNLPMKTGGENFLFVDKNGNTLEIGSDFIIAESENTFPVCVYRTQSLFRKLNEID